MQFKDFYEGQMLLAGHYTITEKEILEFANAYDPQWFHTDIDRANKGPYGGLIASGWQTSSIAMRLVVDAFLKDSNSTGSPGLAYLRWPAPVRPGDTLSVLTNIKQVRTSSSKPDVGIMLWQWQVFNADKVLVLELEATSFFDLTL